MDPGVFFNVLFVAGLFCSSNAVAAMAALNMFSKIFTCKTFYGSHSRLIMTLMMANSVNKAEVFELLRTKVVSPHYLLARPGPI